MVFKSGLNDFLDKNKNRSDQRISLKIEAIFLTRHFLFIFVFLFDSTQKVTHFRHFSLFSTSFQSIQSFYTFFVFPLSIHKELEIIFSDEFLENPEAVKNMDKFIERYTPSYSNLLAAWEINDTICIQLRRFDAFICLHFDNQQIDKISSIRVFDSTTEDEESISQYDFSQDEMGIYLPD